MEITDSMEPLERDIARLKEIRNNNFAIGGLTFGVGMVDFSGAMNLGEQTAVVADVPHEFSDGLVNQVRVHTEQNDLDQEDLDRRRKAGYWILSTIAGGYGLKSGYDFIQFLNNGFPAVSAAETGLKCTLGLIVAGVNRKNRKIADSLETRSENLQDAVKHAKVDEKASYGAAGFIAASGLHSAFSAVGGVFISAYTAWHMRPTRKNLHHHSY